MHGKKSKTPMFFLFLSLFIFFPFSFFFVASTRVAALYGHSESVSLLVEQGARVGHLKMLCAWADQRDFRSMPDASLRSALRSLPHAAAVVSRLGNRSIVDGCLRFAKHAFPFENPPSDGPLTDAAWCQA
jgi:hypothetical protein